MTQPQLAKEAGIKQPSLSELETGETKEISGPVLIALAKALRVRAEWLVTGEGPVEPRQLEGLPSDAEELLRNYMHASKRWRLSLLLMSRLHADDAAQDEVAEGVNVLLAKIAVAPVPDSKLGDKWTRPDKKHP